MLVKAGSYTGNGVSQSITGVGFQPTVVIVKNAVSQIAQIKTDTMTADLSKPMTTGTALQTGQITSLDADGFSVGSGSRSNNNLDTIYYVAFAPGSDGDLVTTSYTGTGVAHEEAIIGFQSDFIQVMSAGANTTVFKHRDHVGSAGNTWTGASVSSYITSITATGFNVGTNANVNTSGTVYHVVAMKARTGTFELFSYVGNGSVDDYNVDGVTTFQPQIAIVKVVSTANGGVIKTVAMGANSVQIPSSAMGADWIQTFRPTGIQVGTLPTVNDTSAVTFLGMAWAERAASSSSYTPSLLTNTQTFYAPTVTLGTLSVTPSLLTDGDTFYAPARTLGTLSVTPSLLTNSQAFYAPTVSSAPTTVTPSLLTNSQTFYAPTTTLGTLSLTPSLLTNTSTLYAPSRTLGTLTVTPDLLVNTQTFYAPSGIFPFAVTPSLLVNTQIFYPPSIIYPTPADVITSVSPRARVQARTDATTRIYVRVLAETNAYGTARKGGLT